ncbi:Lrp/AsnC family transcriptional regulator (plasmid) [Arthrobacter sp. D3-18]
MAKAAAGVSPAIAERTARLSQKGVIDGYTANINWQALRYATIVYLSVLISPGGTVARCSTT